MTKKRKIINIGIAILISIILFYAYMFFIFTNNVGICGMDVGPIYGQKIDLKINQIKIDEYLTYPNGQFGLVNAKISNDTISPILIKFDKNKKLIWAITLDSKESGIPFYEMDNIKLVDDKHGKKITFFNLSYSEPGTIYLTKKFEFNYLCLKAF